MRPLKVQRQMLCSLWARVGRIFTGYCKMMNASQPVKIRTYLKVFGGNTANQAQNLQDLKQYIAVEATPEYVHVQQPYFWACKA